MTKRIGKPQGGNNYLGDLNGSAAPPGTCSVLPPGGEKLKQTGSCEFTANMAAKTNYCSDKRD